MSLLLAVLVLLAGAWALAYAGVSLLAWTGALTLYLVGLVVAGLLAGTAAVVVSVIFAALALLLNMRPLRRWLLTRRLFGGFQKLLPPISQTERDALDAGDTWWETDLFRGRPDWGKLLSLKVARLSEEEQAFLDDQVETLCRMLDQDRIEREDHDLSPEVWEYIKHERFFSLIIPKQYGGRRFSSFAQSCVVSKIGTRSISAAVTVMVPNSLGPGELLMHYGTEAQKDYWLPRLADGREVPCFALTGPDVGSDAGSMPDYGIVCQGMHEGKETLGIRLSFNKRYITLAPVASVLGLAFKLYDPERLLGDREDIGITCALVPTAHPGVHIGERHLPMGLAFMNGPLHGHDVFIPIDWVIGGPAQAGNGWRMLVECLAVGRAISLPALASAAGKVAYRMTGAYARIRRQFRRPIGHFEGVQEAMARIGGYAYRLEAARQLTASAGDLGVKPAVVSAIAKHHMTEMMRTSLNDAMDIHGGRAIIYGPRNYLGSAYQAVPVGITVEGANILTRSLMIFGQGAIRCHPFVFAEMEAARKGDLAEFDRLLFKHIGYSVNRGARALTLGLTGGRLARSPVAGGSARYYRQLERMSAALALASDLSMGLLGGDLKRRERLSARLGDVLSHLYLASAVLKFYHDGGSQPDEAAYVRWSVEDSLAQIYRAFDELFANFPRRWVGRLLRALVFPLGRPYRAPADSVGAEVSRLMMTPGGVRDRITGYAYWGDAADDVTGRLEHAFDLLVRAEPAYDKFQRLLARGQLVGHEFEQQLADALEQGLIGAEEAALLRDYEAARYDAVLTDAFPKAALAPRRAAASRSKRIA